MSAIITVKNVRKTYELGKTTVPALRGVSLSIKPGECVYLGGPSGSGKSTLLHIIGCLDTPSSGELVIDNNNILSIDDNRLSDFRCRNIGFVFQNFNLLPVLNVYENVEYPLMLQKTPNRRQRVMEMLDAVGLADYTKHYPNELSGGQRQRVAVARALVTDPSILIADEPIANLDSNNGQIVLQLMLDLAKTKNAAVIVSTHSDTLLENGNRVIFLKDGLIEDEIHRNYSTPTAKLAANI